MRTTLLFVLTIGSLASAAAQTESGETFKTGVTMIQVPVVVRDRGGNIVSPACQLGSMDPAARVMSLSAIVLEEAYGRGGASSQDGLLTALELQSLDLQGTPMLVAAE